MERLNTGSVITPQSVLQALASTTANDALSVLLTADQQHFAQLFALTQNTNMSSQAPRRSPRTTDLFAL